MNEDREMEIRRLVDTWVEALRAKDVNKRTADYAPDVRVFDVVKPLQHVGVDALRTRLSNWLSTFEGPVDCELRDLAVSADDHVAFCHSLNRFSGTLRDGGTLDMWVRFTTCLRRSGGRWLVTHEHASVPFDAETQRASLDLEP